MQFYDATNKRAICQEIDRLCDTTDTSYPRLDKTARVNSSLEELIGDIINADGTWQYDDTNQTTLPRGKGTLVEGQESYSFASEYLQVTDIEILDKDGIRYERIQNTDNVDLGGLSPQEYFGTESSGSPAKGRVDYYDIQGDSILLYKAPTSTSHTLANGIRVWFKRTASLFTPVSTTAADTTEPGLPSTHHHILAYMSAIPYCMSYKKDRVALYEKKVMEMKDSLLKFYARRNKDRRNIFTMKPITFR